ncbi:4-alpha-glucanotransferase [Thermodesulfobacteriota bacterium]
MADSIDQDQLNTRGNGILLHPSSLFSPFGVGDFGPSAQRFVDFLEETKQKYWQILPLTPTDDINGNSPYHSDSAFAVNLLFISPEILLQEGLISQEMLDNLPKFDACRVDYPSVYRFKNALTALIAKDTSAFLEKEDFKHFKNENNHWLDDYCIYKALKTHFKGKAWYEWPSDLRDRNPESLRKAKERFETYIYNTSVIQYLLQKQWISLRKYSNDKGVKIIGDIPFYVIHDSADVWINPELFNLDQNKMPYTVAGVPPDYFSATGQFWGNPVYRWDVLKERRYDWWLERIRYNIKLYDLIRIDHFRGFVGYWEIPAGDDNAINGRWVEAPAQDFFLRITEETPQLPIIAEDLGVITPDVIALIKQFGFPSMKVLLFAFGDDTASNPYAPHNIPRNCIIYTGTHDNNTTRAWFQKDTTPSIKENLNRYIGKDLTGNNISRELVKLAMMSVADKAIFPLQDILNLGGGARMNKPGVPRGNWEWRLDEDLLTPSLREELRKMTEIYGRA